jgi:predicted small lipoprotein YifL
MLRAAVVAAMLATAYCGAKGPPQPPAGEVPDGGPAASTSSPSPSSGSGGPVTPTGSADAGPP